jgi:hypothetical protein
MSDKLATTLANFNLETPKSKVIDLNNANIVHDTPLADDSTDTNKIASKNDSMLAPRQDDLPDYTNYTGKKKVEMAKPDGTRIPLSIQKRITIMLHEAKMADEPLTKQDIYCRALSRYLESEGY